MTWPRADPAALARAVAELSKSPLGKIQLPVEVLLWQLALIAVAFLSASLGCGFVTLGSHIYDQIEVAERWRRRF